MAVLERRRWALRVVLPPASDRWAERLVGITLLALGRYVLGDALSAVNTQPRSEDADHAADQCGTLLLLALESPVWRHASPQIFEDGCGTTSAFLVGLIHGLGADLNRNISNF